MNNLEQIPLPQFRSATPLSAIELNRLRFGKGLTVLTPDRLRSIAGQTDTPASPQPTLQSNDDWRTHRLPTLPLQLTHPPWAATAKRIGLYLGDYVSIHAPAWGATAIIVTI